MLDDQDTLMPDEIPPPPVREPKVDPHEESTYALWHDPTVYDAVKHGPPYLPEPKVARTASAGFSKAVKDAVRPLVQKTATDEMPEIAALIEHIQLNHAHTPMSELAALLAFIQAESQVHQSHHWQTSGEPFYGDHLLFDRLYSTTYGQIDKLAERMVGSGGHDLAHPVLLAVHCALVVRNFYQDAGANPSSDMYPALSLRATLRTLVALRVVYAELERKGTLSHGIDNLLQGMADEHESHVYLLRQRVLAKTATYDRRAGVEVGMEFPTLDSLKKYLHLHPKADPSNHSVEPDDMSGEDVPNGDWTNSDDPNLDHGGWSEVEASDLKWKRS